MNAMANGPSIKPDWSTATKQSLNLSGQQITFSLPGNISTDIPARISSNLNIYDPDIYYEWKNQEIAKVW